MPNKVVVTYDDRKKAEPYAAALRRAGLEPVLVSAEDARSLVGLDGLVLTGGCDIDPKQYGQEPAPETQKPNPARDRMEMGLLGEALDRDLPVLAICRGLQLLNVYKGGTLVQHLKGDPHRPPERPRTDPARPMHDVRVAADTKLSAILGEGQHPVNSRHHQAIDKVGAGLRISASSVKDGIVEGIELPDKEFVVAVQWHSEDQAASSETQMKLFQAFAAAVNRRSAG
ncbi:MAG TPA: gamma-glutamyl-gamma-aminobutyrate hydrolase family protein [Bryobacteraceae bacterium]|nr:gamma-glutamyl-gamma-aminobutyrate hydrolase family protein [Bryobacteraceae bacterium]